MQNLVGGRGGGNKVYYGRSASAVWAMGSRRGVKQRKGMMEGCTSFHKERRRLSIWTIGILTGENKITFPVQILNHFKVCPLLFLEFGFGVPVVTVVVEGGLDALKAVKESVKYGIPSVVVDGTRRAADILAFAHNNCECERQVKIRVVQSQRRSIYCF